MMNPEVKSKWVAALRSGEYTQGRNMLKALGKHCCLGVLCEVSETETGFGIDENKEEGEFSFIGPTLKKWAGLDLHSGAMVTIDGVYNSLSYHNDTGRTFAQIADAIETQL